MMHHPEYMKTLFSLTLSPPFFSIVLLLKNLSFCNYRYLLTSLSFLQFLNLDFFPSSSLIFLCLLPIEKRRRKETEEKRETNTQADNDRRQRAKMNDEKDKAEDQHLADLKGAMTTAVSSAIDDVETREYNHSESANWIKRICEVTLEKLQSYRRPYKYVITCTIARNMAPRETRADDGEGGGGRTRKEKADGKGKEAEKQVTVATAGLHLCTSCYYGQQDGVFSLKSDAATKMHIVTTVFWTTF